MFADDVNNSQDLYMDELCYYVIRNRELDRTTRMLYLYRYVKNPIEAAHILGYDNECWVQDLIKTWKKLNKISDFKLSQLLLRNYYKPKWVKFLLYEPEKVFPFLITLILFMGIADGFPDKSNMIVFYTSSIMCLGYIGLHYGLQKYYNIIN